MAKNWLWARDKMKSARSKNSGKPLLGNQSTYIVVSRVSPTQEWETDKTVFALALWGTELVRYYPGGVVSASLNGWSTVTTKARIRTFSPLSIGTHNGQVVAWCSPDVLRRAYNSTWIGDEYTWFHWKDGRLVFPNGMRMPDLHSARIKKSVPKRRDPRVRPLEGDAFREGSQFWVVAVNIKEYPRRCMFYPYFGDHPDDRSLVITDHSVIPRELPGDLEMLAASHSGGLTPVNRFLWEKG